MKYLVIAFAIIAILFKLFLTYWVWIPAFLDLLTFPMVLPNAPVNWRKNEFKNKGNESKPNIIVILADDLGINDISYYFGGHHGIETPHINSIALHGISFSNAYAGHGTCAPSRAALLTGRYASKIGLEYTPCTIWGSYIISWLGNGPLKGIFYREESRHLTEGNFKLPESEITIADSLSKHDYKTIFLGKWHNGNTDEFKPIMHGYDEYLSFSIISRYLHRGDPEAQECVLEDLLDQYLRAVVRYQILKDGGPYFEPNEYLTDYLAHEASKAIEANKDQPFHLFLSMTAVHTPLTAMKSDYDALSHIANHCDRVYAAMIVALDRAVGKVLQSLKDNGLEENTIVVFASDNGAAAYVNQRESNRPLRGWKATFFEGGVRSPLFIKWPNMIQAGSKSDAVVGLIDIYPTVLAAAGVTVSHDIDGMNLLPHIPLVADKQGNQSKDGNTFEGHEELFYRSSHYMALRKGDWKIQQAQRPNKIWLHNLKNDQSERDNLAEKEEFKAKKLEMLQRLHQINESQRAPLWPSLSECPVLIDKFYMEPYEEGDEYVYWAN